MEFQLERWRTLVRAVADGPGLGVQRLAEAAGVSRQVLKPNYEGPKQSTMEKVAAAAADLLHLDHAQLAAWLVGHAEPAIARFLADLPHMRQCRSCSGWFDTRTRPGKRSQFVESTGRCRPCNQREDRQAKSATSPRQVQIRAELRAQLPQLQDRDPDLARAVVAALESPEAVTMPRLAQRLGPEVQARTLAARLRRSIASLVLLRILAGGSSDGNAMTTSRTKELVRRDRRLRAPSSTSTPKAARRRRRKGATTGQAVGYFSTAEARA